MPILECPGIFQVVLPDGWKVTGEPGRAYDVWPSDNHLGINLSVVDPTVVQAHEPEELVRRFARVTGLDEAQADDVPVFTVPGEDSPPQNRHFASFLSDGRTWFVGLLIFPGGNVLATSNSPSDNATLAKTGELIIASIAPVD